ncbi:esterase B1 isoform X2 [Drosophila willistoni]|uniref:esterase B1 isoform X2 n=1 Tax=Drosophila willistoni TaxID=7260 RepID=UPI000C26C5C8|nr:esterase B1 isoform X2 [Drosophila willistoni]
MSFDIAIADQMRIALNYVKFKTKQQRLRSNDKVIADTIYGKVKGVKWQSIYGNNYYSFEGIPFAKPPVGDLRFKAPVEPDHWTEVKRCTRERTKPCQVNIVMNMVQGSEDCLYLNVYTRELHPQKPLPVLVWIYGGGFQMGEASRDLYSPDYFMMEHVVLISISYRLGALGFLTLEDEELDVPGNAGLKDQVMALRWVKNNCQFFGGDPNNITVFGESAGGASTHYMTLTEQTRDLFHKAVIMSGSAIAPWSITPQFNWAYRLAQATGYTGEQNDRQVLAHLKKTKASIMLKVADDIITMEERHQRKVMFSFGPSVEPYDSPHCVIPKPPLEMMRNCWGNSIPMVVGGNSFEGLLMFPEVRKWPDLLCHLGECEYLAPEDAGLNEEQRRAFGKQLKALYFGDKKPSRETILQYSDLFSYKYFWHAIQRTLLSRVHHASKAPTFLYRFDFDSKHFNTMRIITCGRKVRGTCHGDDLSYIFYNAAAKKLKRRTAEFKTIHRFISMLVQFAACGDPNIPLIRHDHDHNHDHDMHSDAPGPDGEPEVWLPISSEDKVFKCLNISHDVQVIDLPEAEKLRIWDSMYVDRRLLY